MSDPDMESSSSAVNVKVKGRSRPNSEGGGPLDFPRQRFSESLVPGVELYVSHLWSLSTMTVFAKQDQGKADAMHNKVGEMLLQNQLKAYTEQPLVGELVLAGYGMENGMPMHINRGIVEETFENGEVTVLFLDLGDKVRALYNECYEIPDEILGEPIYGLMIQLPGIPEGADSLLSKKLQELLIAEHEIGFVKFTEDHKGLPAMVSVGRPLKVENYLIKCKQSNGVPIERKMITWQEVVRRAIVCSGNQLPMDQSWNPWSTKGMEVISKACNGNEEMIQFMIASNLIEWSQQFYRPYLEDTKEYQINLLRTKCKTLVKADVFQDANWSDTIKGFHYTEKDVPIAFIPQGEEITVRVRHFASPTDWTGIIVSEPFLSYQKALRRILDKHCNKAMKKNEARGIYKRQFLPECGEFCFIYLHTWKDMDRMMRDDKRGKWQPRYDRRTPNDDQEANHWYRAVSSGPTTKGTYCRYWHFYLIDLGRFVVTPEDHILPGLLKFLLIPKLAIRGSFPIHSFAIKEHTNTSWYTKMKKGIKLDLRVLESEIHYKTLVEIVLNEKSNSLHNLIKPKIPGIDGEHLAGALQRMTARLDQKYHNMLSAADHYDDDDDDY